MWKSSLIATAASLGVGLVLSASPAEAQGKVKGGGPPFCQNGQGHPVHGWEWCEKKGYSRYGGYPDRGRYDTRYPDPDGRYDGHSGSYEARHEDFHRYLDRKYSRLAAERPLDIRYQIELRARKSREHDDWHYRMGRRH